ncbi:MAG: gliding motility-associated C-terminal domain-containing protein [Marinifilaceae bacterium]|jgi:gliding motility-associated-like protein|nr:gliding motility-associated C-terminal domain-containing protein [Marinifilaceae bacterium]
MLRKLIYIIYLIAGLIILSGNIVSAQHIDIMVGESREFEIPDNPNFTFHWELEDPAGTIIKLPSNTNKTAKRIFNTPGNHIVRVQAEDRITACLSEKLEITVNVIDAAPTAIWKNTPTIVCAANDNLSSGRFELEVEYNGPRPWTFKYKLDGSVAKTPHGAEQIMGNTFKFETFYRNNTKAPKDIKLELVEAKTLTGIPVTVDAAEQIKTITVRALPNPQFLRYTNDAMINSIQHFTVLVGKLRRYTVDVPYGATKLNEKITNYDAVNDLLEFDIQWGDIEGDYEIGVRDENAEGCESDNVKAYVELFKEKLVYLGPDRTLCVGSSLTLVPEHPDPSREYEYTWFDSNNDKVKQINAGGVYWIKAVDKKSGAYDSDYVVITEIPLPDVNLGADILLTVGETRELDAGNFTGASYLWSTGETTRYIDVNKADTYNVTVTSAEGCIGKDEINVTSMEDVFVINLGSDITRCAGETVTLDPRPNYPQAYTYSWSNGATSPTIDVTTEGEYTVSVIDPKGNKKEDKIYVTFNESPIVDLGDDLSLFAGETIDLDAGNAKLGEVYEWSTGDTDQSIKVNIAGLYSVKVTNKYNCSNTDDVNIIFRNGERFTVDVGADKAICEGESVRINAILDVDLVGEIYKWKHVSRSKAVNNLKDVSNTITIDQTGQYCVTVTDQYGNTEEDCMDLIVSPRPIVDLGGTIKAAIGTNVTLDAKNPGAFYTWNDDANSVSQKIEVDKSGEYMVTVTNEEGCSTTDLVSVEISGNIKYYVEFPSAFRPTGDKQNIKTFGPRHNGVKTYKLLIYDRTGHLMFKSTDVNDRWDGRYNGKLQVMDAYVYFVKVEFLNGTKKEKHGNVSLIY